ncbi:hypothetical protein DB347_09990 [Opitutaceae bacterium EW11]|nr:hypothetical protein DB347_09990 [Opitutaceae bacterium EW11]
MKLTALFGAFAAALLAVLAGCQSSSAPSAAGKTAAEKPQLKLGLQTYTFRDFTFAQALDKAKAAGIPYLQAYRGQTLGGGLDGQFGHEMDAATRTKVLALVKERGLHLVSYGVVIGKDETEWRQIFDFAKAMGMEEIATEPPPDTMPLVAQLSKETGIRVALHNHPTPSIYHDPEFALSTVQPYGENVGLCADTGHWVRSGYDPIESLRKAKGRIIQLHFKDLNERGVKEAHDVPWGLGASNASGQLLELRRQGFSGYLFVEYEHNTPSLESDVGRCAEYFRRAVAASEDELARNAVVPPQQTGKVDDVFSGGRGKNSALWPSPTPLLAADLSNAEFKPGSWAWENGVLVAKGGGDLWTKESYGDFALSLEFRCAADSNSGVFLRCADPAEWLQTSIEVQIRQGDEPDGKHLVGAIFDVLAPTRQIAIEPGEWYRFVIVAKGNRIQVSLNGEPLTDAKLDQWTEAHKNPDGSPNKFNTPYKDMPRSGRIGLQYHGTPIAFRNLLVERL